MQIKKFLQQCPLNSVLSLSYGKTIIGEKPKPLNSESATSNTLIDSEFTQMQKKKFHPEFTGKYSVNSGHAVIPNVRKTKNSESGTFFPRKHS